MKTINISCTSKVSNFFIGRRGENDVTEVLFDYSAWIEEFGQGIVTLLVKRSKDINAYPVVVETVGDTARWLVSSTDTAYKGSGFAEFVYTVDSKIAKSMVFVATVLPDIGEPSETPPDPYETWLESLTGIAADAQEEALVAEGYANGQQNGVDVGSGSIYYHNNAKYWASLSPNVIFWVTKGSTTSNQLRVAVARNVLPVLKCTEGKVTYELPLKSYSWSTLTPTSSSIISETYTFSNGNVICYLYFMVSSGDSWSDITTVNYATYDKNAASGERYVIGGYGQSKSYYSFDTEPTQNNKQLVNSGAIYTALQDLRESILNEVTDLLNQNT